VKLSESSGPGALVLQWRKMALKMVDQAHAGKRRKKGWGGLPRTIVLRVSEGEGALRGGAGSRSGQKDGRKRKVRGGCQKKKIIEPWEKKIRLEAVSCCNGNGWASGDIWGRFMTVGTDGRCRDRAKDYVSLKNRRATN